MKYLIKIFPIQLLKKRKLVKNKAEMYELINRYSKPKPKTNINFSLYSPNSENKFENVLVDKVFFDFDEPERSWDDECKLHSYLIKEEIRHLMTFSGAGFHLYIFTKKFVNLKNPKQALLNAHNFFCQTLDLALDPCIKGNVAGMGRFPNTYNIRRRRYCIPLSLSDLKKGLGFIKEKAKKQNFKFVYYGDKLLDMSKFDSAPNEELLKVSLDVKTKSKINFDGFLKKLPLCIAKMLVRKHLGWRRRFLVISYFRDKGYLYQESAEILKRHLSPKEFRHCVLEEKQLQYLYKRLELFFPKCEQLEMEGFCIEGCKLKNKLYR